MCLFMQVTCDKHNLVGSKNGGIFRVDVWKINVGHSEVEWSGVHPLKKVSRLRISPRSVVCVVCMCVTACARMFLYSLLYLLTVTLQWFPTSFARRSLTALSDEFPFISTVRHVVNKLDVI